MTVAVLSDSTAAIPPDIAAEYGITVVPIWLTVGGRAYQDGTLDQEELIARFDEGISTSGPSAGEFEDAISSVLADDGAVLLTVSGDFSATVRAARVAAGAFDGKVRVVDTKMVAAAQALVVMAAAAAAKAGCTLDEVEAAADRAIGEARLVATLDTLDYLVKSGRIPGVAGWVGKRAGLRPLVEFSGGKIHPLRPAFSRDAALTRVIARWKKSQDGDGRLHVAALHSMDEESARRLLDEVRSRVEPETAFLSEFGPAMVAYTGPGVVGLAWRWERDGT
ncbi:MAG: DegV family protein [Actinomycetota bacterium]|nr:DegV family protein [Actinomycetota bacterium]